MTRASRPVVCVTTALVVVLALPTLAAGKRKPPLPPPDTAADCTFFVEPSIDDYIVLATLSVGVRCATAKQRITVTASSFTRDGAAVPLIPYDTLTCTNTSSCAIGIDLFSYDNHPVAFAGDQRYCVTGFGVVGGQVVGPGAGCEEDDRI